MLSSFSPLISLSEENENIGLIGFSSAVRWGGCSSVILRGMALLILTIQVSLSPNQNLDGLNL